ncbi:hypothetical protein B0H17DRAFT_1067543 [Mycena rosella]|uniref:Secreted protein n=1 Tax=Mycena rosella TaxID=1033263 RepID=A0AAD7DDX4_MYCRO|nr:hypothetical protein B0H17DRAFT_1067543 [Mycena rosella]
MPVSLCVLLVPGSLLLHPWKRRNTGGPFRCFSTTEIAGTRTSGISSTILSRSSLPARISDSAFDAKDVAPRPWTNEADTENSDGARNVLARASEYHQPKYRV